MTKHSTLIGCVFNSNHSLSDAENPTWREYSPMQHMTWGTCVFMDLHAYAIEDDIGLVDLGIGIKSQKEAETYASETILRHWPEGVRYATRNDARASEICHAAIQGKPFSLHIVTTPFQERVLRTACTIPRGEVRTYGWIAKKIGDSKASRAVANALSRNPIAIVVPCHRVVPSTGKVGGYACGTELKTRILKAEGVEILARNSLVLPPE